MQDLDKDGKVSREEFIAMRNAIRLFVKNAKCQEMFIEVLAGLVAAHWQVGGDDDTSVAHKTTEVYPYVGTHMSTYIVRHTSVAHITTEVRARACSLSLALSLSLSLSLSCARARSLSLSFSFYTSP